MTNQQFVEMAQPHRWFIVADNLHDQAVKLRKSLGQVSNALYTRRTGLTETLDATNRSVFLLCGFALENALKSFLVYENPGWISDGSLSKKLRTHYLIRLSQLSTLAPYKKQSQSILHGFEDGLESWARYPCGLSMEGTSKEKELSEKLWKGYKWLMPAYGKRLKNLLAKDWYGPHGFYCSYKFEGEWLGAS